MASNQKSNETPAFVPPQLAVHSTGGGNTSTDDGNMENYELDLSLIRPLEAWQLEAISRKAELFRQYNEVCFDIKKDDQTTKQDQDRIEQVHDDLEKLHGENEKFRAECAEFDSVFEKLNETKADLSTQIGTLTNQVEKNVRVKMQHFLNSLCKLNRKKQKVVSEFKANKAKFEQTLQEKTAEVEGKLLAASELEQELAQAEEESKLLDSAFAEVDSEIEAEAEKEASVNAMQDEIEACEAVGAQISSENEELSRDLDQLLAQVALDEEQLKMIDQQVMMKKEDGLLLDAEIELSDERIDELDWMLKEIKDYNAPFDTHLDDDAFKRNLFSTDWFESLKANLEMLEDDNADLEGELTKADAHLSEQEAAFEEINSKIAQKRSELDRLQQKIKLSEEDHTFLTLELNEGVKILEKINADSLKEVLDLQAAVQKAQEELQQAETDKELSIKKYEKMLVIAKAKVLRAQEVAKESQRRRLSVSSVTSVKSDSSGAQVKQEPVATKPEPGVSSTQPKPSVSSSQPKPMFQFITPKKEPASTQPVAQQRRSLTPMQEVPPVVKQKRSLTPKQETQVVQSRRSLPSMLETPQDLPRFQLTRENLKRRSLELKENDIPVSLDDTLITESSPKRSRLEEEKAFDSDDSTSFNISFNTDVNDFLE